MASTSASGLFPRFVSDELNDALSDTPVVAINGARQVGKSTLVTTLLGDQVDAHVTTLDDEVLLASAQADPISFVNHKELVVIDEVQRVPALLRAIKAQVDRDRRPGRFLLTGSTMLLSVPELGRSLAGRVALVNLWPLSQGEIAGQREGFVDALFVWDSSRWRNSALRRKDYFERICAGGLPEPLSRAERRRTRWFDDYATTVVERMVAETADIARLDAMPRLLRLCAARTANELNVRDIADDMQIPYRTVSNYLLHLRNVFLVHAIPAWSRNLTSKVVRRPKVVVVDSGVAAHLVGVNPTAMAAPTATVTGQLVETFVAMELLKQKGWSQTDFSLCHYRDRSGVEVDLVLEARDGRVAGVEVKASATVRGEDFRGLRLLQDRLGDQFAGGVVLYTGPDAAPFGERLAALPLAALWETTAERQGEAR